MHLPTLIWGRHRRGIFFLLLSLLSLAACEPALIEPAYSGTLLVTVLDGSTGQPVANVAVSTAPATGSYVTDAKGQLTITQVPVGTVSVTARRAGYDATSGSATIGSNQTQAVVLLLNKTASPTPAGTPTRPTPATGAIDQATSLTLAWHPATGALASDSLRYDVVLYESSSQRQLLTSSKDTTVAVSGLRYGTTYYWQVLVRNPAGGVARGPVWSFLTKDTPDNRYLYARTVSGNTDIYSSDGQGNNLIRLTSAATVETAPQLSPTRDLIAYASNASGQYQLYTMNRDGSNQRRITTFSAEGYSNAGIGYRWSPDGAYLLYAHYDQLYRINRDGSGLMLLARAPAGRHFRECDWTDRNGGRLVVQTIGSDPFDSELYLYNVNGSSPQLLVGNLPGRVDSPSFSTDGSLVLYSHDAAGFNDPGGRQLNCHLYLQPLDGSAATDVTAGNGGTTKALGTNDVMPRFSPTGFQLIFVNRLNDDIGLPEVWTCDLDGRNRTKLFDNAYWPDYR